MAQSVARRLGKAEVGGSSPLDSFFEVKSRKRSIMILRLLLYLSTGL